MLTVKSNTLELRGIANKETKKGNIYYVLNCEGEDGTPYAFYCPSSDAFPEGLKKGCMISVEFEVKRYNGNEQLIVRQVHMRA